MSINRRDILKFLVLVIMVFVPLYPKFPFISVSGTFVTVRAEDFLIGASLLLWIGLNLGDYRVLTSKIFRAFIIFSFIGFVSMLSSVFVTKTVEVPIGFLHWARRIEYFVPFLIASSFVKSRREINFIVKILMIVIFAVFLYGVGQKYFRVPIITTQNAEYSRGVAQTYNPGGHLISTFAGHYDMASFLVFVLPIIWLVLLEDGRSWKMRIVAVLVIAAGFWLLIQSVSRISFATYLGGVSLAMILGRKYKFVPLFLIISMLFIVFAGNLLARYGNIIEVGIRRLYASEASVPQRRVSEEEPTPVPIPVFEDRSTSIRLNVEWPRAIRAWKKNMLLGTGYSSITLATDNDFLRALGEVGILGLAAFCILLVRVFQVGLSGLKKERTIFAGFIGGFAAVLVNAMFIDIFEASKFAMMFWLMTGLLYSYAKHLEK